MKQKYGQIISTTEAEKQRDHLLKFFEILIKVDQRNNIEKIKK